VAIQALIPLDESWPGSALSLSLSLIPGSAMTPSTTSTHSPASTAVPTIAVTELPAEMHVPPLNSYQEEDDHVYSRIPKHNPKASSRWTVSRMQRAITPSPVFTPLQTPNPSRSASPVGGRSLDSEQSAKEDRQKVGKGQVMK